MFVSSFLRVPQKNIGPQTIQCLQAHFEKDPEFQNALSQSFDRGQLLDRQQLIAVLGNMPRGQFLALHESIQALGFQPDLNFDAEMLQKEKMRVATFLVRQFEQIRPQLSTLLSLKFQ